MSFLDLVLPRACASCRARTLAVLCEACDRRVDWIRPPFCARCGSPAPRPTPACGECAPRPPVYARARAAACYRGPARDALLSFKLLGERRAAAALAQAMLAVADIPRGATVTFVPSSRRSLEERGFNPAHVLAGALAGAAGLPVRALLRLVHEPPDLARLDRDARRAALAGAFRAAGNPGGPVLLVDDVYTTGATANACAATLARAGVPLVNVVTFARTLNDWPLSTQPRRA